MWKQPADHAGAAGITVSQAHYPQMVRAMVQYMEDNPLPEQEDVLYYDLDLSEDELPAALETLKSHAPYGQGLKSQYLRCETTAWSPKVPKPIARWENSRNTLSCLAGLRTP